MLTPLIEQLSQSNTTLVAVSKTKPEAAIMKLYQQGQRIFGENRVQELAWKYEALPNDIQWHMIGHLQSNKVKQIAGFVKLIHSVESLKLLKEINKQAKKQERVIDCLLQFHIATEESKFGLSLGEAESLLANEGFKELQNIRIVGVMGMASFVEEESQVRTEFKALYHLFTVLKAKYFSDKDYFKEISMGMSGDYQIAIEEGSTIVRIGSLLFGAR